MKFVLIPLLIIGMFVSFAAALVAMLFFTNTVEKPEQVWELFVGGPDSTEVLEPFQLTEDRLQDLFALGQEYRMLQEEQAQMAAALAESLAAERNRVQALRDSLLNEKKRLGLISDSTLQASRQGNLEELARFYANIKAQQAAEILQQEGTLSDTTVARLMQRLPPRHMAKIMGTMNPDFAARITVLMKEMAP